MSLKIVRNDITKMNTEAIVNTANEEPIYSTGCDTAVYLAAGKDELLEYRQKHIGYKEEGEVFITPGFKLPAKYIIHTVSPYYDEENEQTEVLLRGCYQKALQLALDNNIQSIAFPLISTGGFGCPKEVGMMIALDEIGTFLLKHEMEVYIVVFDSTATLLAEKIFPDLKAYIDHNYVCEKREVEYGDAHFGSARPGEHGYDAYMQEAKRLDKKVQSNSLFSVGRMFEKASVKREESVEEAMPLYASPTCARPMALDEEEEFYADSDLLNRKKAHLMDPFGKYLLYYIEEKGMTNPEVYNRAMYNNKFFYKITKDPAHYHPDKLTALRLCIGAKMNIDEATDLLARAGYAFSPSSMTDIIFKYFIEHEHWDLIDIDIELENYGEECIIS